MVFEIFTNRNPLIRYAFTSNKITSQSIEDQTIQIVPVDL